MQGSNKKMLQSFLDYLKYEKRYSLHTCIAYEGDITSFADYLETHYGASSWKEVGHSHIRSWLAQLKNEGISSRSINRKISSLKTFYKYHLRAGAIASSPLDRVITPKTGKRLPVFLKEKETRELVAGLTTATEDWKSLNAKMLVSIFYATGMRLQELITLKEKQIDLGRSQIKVLGKGNKERIIPVSRDIVGVIKDYRKEKEKRFPGADDVLLVTEKGKKLYAKYAYLLVNHSLGQSSTLDKRSPHVLRHTFATHLLDNGANLNAIKELLGHSSLAATQVYTHNTIEKLKDVYKKAHPKA